MSSAQSPANKDPPPPQHFYMGYNKTWKRSKTKLHMFWKCYETTKRHEKCCESLVNIRKLCWQYFFRAFCLWPCWISYDTRQSKHFFTLADPINEFRIPNSFRKRSLIASTSKCLRVFDFRKRSLIASTSKCLRVFDLLKFYLVSFCYQRWQTFFHHLQTVVRYPYLSYFENKSKRHRRVRVNLKPDCSRWVCWTVCHLTVQTWQQKWNLMWKWLDVVLWHCGAVPRARRTKKPCSVLEPSPFLPNFWSPHMRTCWFQWWELYKSVLQRWANIASLSLSLSLSHDY